MVECVVCLITVKKSFKCMFIISKYILREHVGPFLFGLMTIVFLFLLNVVFRDLGKLLGKGIPIGVMFEFFGLNLAWIVALAIPMAVLVATLMAFGRLSSDNEIVALKASGVHLYRLITPVIIVAVFLAVGVERFHNSVLPEFNHRYRLLFSDISKKRPTLALEENVFFNEIPNYSLLVHDLIEEGEKNILKGIIIHDYSDPEYSQTVIAESGQLAFSEEREKMIFTLFNVEIHSVELADLENYRMVKSKQWILSVPVSNMVLERSQSEHRGDREKSADMLREDIARYLKQVAQREENIRRIVQLDLKQLFIDGIWSRKNGGMENNETIERDPSDLDRNAKTRQVFQRIQAEMKLIEGQKLSILSKQVEIQKKYSIPVACIVFVLIGAPLGIMARQGGMAVGGGLSLLFFIIYWIFIIAGEQLADRGYVSPFIAMWIANILVGFGGIYLVVKSVRESTFIPWDRLAQWFKKIVKGRRT